MENKVYKNEYNQVEKCFNCNENYVLDHLDQHEPLEVYRCKCGKKKYKSINNYEG